jgi:hypothetical protein
MKISLKVLASLLLMVTASMAANANVVKQPDLGTYWSPLYPDGGTYIYANSFVADASGTDSNLGFWAANGGGAGKAQVVLGIYGSGASPDSTNVLARTGVINLTLTGSLQFFDAATLFSSNLSSGTQYWFAADVIGLTADTPIQVGGHTRNSGGIVDNGTFWYSNDPTGTHFDGSNLNPEMAFSVETQVNQVPEPNGVALFGLGLAAIGFALRRKAKAASQSA